ncbi:MAG: TPM domain-containing protein [Eubacteriales bacterium]|nr:TPM domain-containing protein [Eubacteriales bacterium]
MKKRIIIIALTLILAAMLAFPSFADDSIPRYYEEYDLLSDDEEASINAKLEEMSDRLDADVVIWVTSFFGNLDEESFIDACRKHISNNFGYKSNGYVIMMIDLEAKETYFYIYSEGKVASKAFSDEFFDDLGDDVISLMESDKCFEAMNKYADSCDEAITESQKVKYFSVTRLIIAAVIGLIIGASVTGSNKAKLKTVRSKTEANYYVREGSMTVNDSRDIYLYSKVTRTEKPRNDGSSGSSGSSHSVSSGLKSGKR